MQVLNDSGLKNSLKESNFLEEKIAGIKSFSHNSNPIRSVLIWLQALIRYLEGGEAGMGCPFVIGQRQY